MKDLQTVLESAKTIAVVGCSPQPERDSHRIAQYLQKAGYTVIPVNPNIDIAIGEHSYPDLLSIPDDVTIDIVNIFRRPSATADMVRDAVKRTEKTGEKLVIWTQLGVHSDDAEQLARDAGLPYVKNRCIRMEHQFA